MWCGHAACGRCSNGNVGESGDMSCVDVVVSVVIFFFQAEDGIRDLVRSRGLGDVYKRQLSGCS